MSVCLFTLVTNVATQVSNSETSHMTSDVIRQSPIVMATGSRDYIQPANGITPQSPVVMATGSRDYTQPTNGITRQSPVVMATGSRDYTQPTNGIRAAQKPLAEVKLYILAYFTFNFTVIYCFSLV